MIIDAHLDLAFNALQLRRDLTTPVEEIRRQFKEIPGLMEGTGQPDYNVCINIATVGALFERKNVVGLYDGNLAYADAEFGRVVEALLPGPGHLFCQPALCLHRPL